VEEKRDMFWCHRDQRFKESPSEAIITFCHRKRSFDGDKPWSVWKNEKQPYLNTICKKLERKGNDGVP